MLRKGMCACFLMGLGFSVGMVVEEQEVKETALRLPRSCCWAIPALADVASVRSPPVVTLRLQISWNRKTLPRQLLVGGNCSRFFFPNPDAMLNCKGYS